MVEVAASGAPVAVRSLVRRLRIVGGITALLLIAAAHVGTLDAFFRGNAGPYLVQVTVRPPGVVPGQAQIIIRTDGPDVTRVTTQAATWNLGSKGAPPPDEALRTPGDSALWTSELWLMARGSYAINVSITGPRGTGSVAVPFTSIATRQLRMSGSLGWILAGLGVFLVVGLVSIIGTAARESVLVPGMALTPRQKRRGRLAMIGGAVVVGLGLTGGRAWWNAVDAAYSQSLFRPMDALVSVTSAAGGGERFRLSITDSLYLDGTRPPIIPDHGKPIHLFLIREEGGAALAHLHPAQLDKASFEGPIPALPGGAYRYYADVVQESGSAQTLTGRVTIGGHAATSAPGDPDDATFVGTPAADSVTRVPAGLSVTFSRPAVLAPATDVLLQFTIRDSSGAVVSLEPYMGMPAHAMIARTDGEVFAHLHSNGSFSMAAQQVLMAVERGDTLASSRPNVPRPRLDTMSHASSHATPTARGQLAFPFAFPSPGTYFIWIQFRHNGGVRTAAFSIVVR